MNDTERLEGEDRCANHSNRQTRVYCSDCGKPICPDCMVFGPVGIKCRECASLSRGMLRRGKPSQYVGAVAFGLIAAVLGTVALVAIRFAIPFAGFFSFFLYAGYGYAVGEAVAKGAQGNRGPVFMGIAAGCSGLGLVWTLVTSGIYGLLFAGLAIVVAASRLKGA